MSTLEKISKYFMDFTFLELFLKAFLYFSLFITPLHIASSNVSSSCSFNDRLKEGDSAAAELLLAQIQQASPSRYPDLFLSLALYMQNPHMRFDTIFSALDFLSKKGFAPAMEALAGFYFEGVYLQKNLCKAFLLYQCSADRGYGPAQFHCGIMLKKGEGIPQNLQRAFLYLALAALNHRDLEDLVEDAAFYRNEVARLLSPLQYQGALRAVGKWKPALLIKREAPKLPLEKPH